MIDIVTKHFPTSFSINHIYGKIGGGMLEFVKIEEYEHIVNEGQVEIWVRLYFTNHDVQATKDCIEDCPITQQHKLLEKQYFVIECPKFH
jgi:hypothetical protein